jgi:predicted O-methyltransferase YrrM
MIKTMRSKKSLHGLREFAECLRGVETMVEVGSWTGESAAVFSPLVVRLICVDPWDDYKGESGKDILAEFLKRMGPFNNVEMLRMTSVEAACHFADGQIDAVYIDGRHDYENVKADILAWKPKVKTGGIIAGHDYGPHAPGVIKAVNEVFGKPSRVYGDTSWRA